MSDRINRKDLKHDRFVEGAGDTIVSVREHARTALAIAIAAIVLIVAAVGFVAWRRTVEERAQTSLAEAISTFERPLRDEAPEGTAEDRSFASEDERLQKSQPLFQAVVDQYGSSDAADVARLYLGQILVRQGKSAEALPLFEEFLSDHDDHFLAGSAQMSVYQIRMAEGQKSEVVAEMEQQLSSDTPRLPKDVLLAMLAEAYEAEGERVKARDAWQRLANEFPDSAYAIDAQRKIARI